MNVFPEQLRDLYSVRPYGTLTISAVAAVIVCGEYLLKFSLGYPSVPKVLDALFFTYPLVSVAFWPFLHRGFGHLLGNLVLLGIAGPFIESRLDSRKVIILLTVAGYLTLIVQASVDSLGGAENPYSVGLSGAALAAVSTAASLYWSRARDTRSPVDIVIFLLMVALVIRQLARDIPLLTIAESNVAVFAHGTGVLLGLAVGKLISHLGLN